MPALEVMANKDYFTGRRLESVGMENLSPVQRKRAWTSETAVGISKAMDTVLWDKAVLSPIQVQHLVQGYLGWFGAFTLASLDMLYRNATGAPDKPDWKAEDYPVVGSFTSEEPQRNTRFVTEFYENLDTVNKVQADIRHNIEYGRKEVAMEMMRDNKKSLAWKAAYNSTQRELANLNKKSERIQSSDLPGSVKREQLDRIDKLRNEMTRRLVEKSESAF
jgi:hypothetical protein